jgi:hypothetical protein
VYPRDALGVLTRVDGCLLLTHHAYGLRGRLRRRYLEHRSITFLLACKVKLPGGSWWRPTRGATWLGMGTCSPALHRPLEGAGSGASNRHVASRRVCEVTSRADASSLPVPAHVHTGVQRVRLSLMTQMIAGEGQALVDHHRVAACMPRLWVAHGALSRSSTKGALCWCPVDSAIGISKFKCNQLLIDEGFRLYTRQAFWNPVAPFASRLRTTFQTSGFHQGTRVGCANGKPSRGLA